MTEDNNGQSERKVVFCIFERNEDDLEQGNLLRIYQNPKDALQYIESEKHNDLFWEQWELK